MLYQWSYSDHGELACGTQHNTLEMRPGCHLSVVRSFLLPSGVPWCTHHPVEGYLGGSFSAIPNKAAVNIMYVCTWICAKIILSGGECTIAWLWLLRA